MVKSGAYRAKEKERDIEKKTNMLWHYVSVAYKGSVKTSLTQYGFCVVSDSINNKTVDGRIPASLSVFFDYILITFWYAELYFLQFFEIFFVRFFTLFVAFSHC